MFKGTKANPPGAFAALIGRDGGSQQRLYERGLYRLS